MEPLFNFVYTRVIIGVILIDVLITLIDLLILPIVARVEPKELDEKSGVEVPVEKQFFASKEASVFQTTTETDL